MCVVSMYVCVCVCGVHMFWVGVHLVEESVRENCVYSELFWSAFSRIRTEYGEILRITRYSVRMRENADQNNSEYGHFSRSEFVSLG